MIGQFNHNDSLCQNRLAWTDLWREKDLKLVIEKLETELQKADTVSEKSQKRKIINTVRSNFRDHPII